MGYGVIGLQNLPFEVGHEDGIRRVLDKALGIGARFVELSHVAQDADGADHLTVRVSQRRGVQCGRDHVP